MLTTAETLTCVPQITSCSVSKSELVNENRLVKLLGVDCFRRVPFFFERFEMLKSAGFDGDAP